MEEYLHNLKTLRSQMNDVEDQAAKISVDEQSQVTAIHTMEIDLSSVKSDTKRLKEETDRMVMAKGQICSKILDKQKKIASLEADSTNLSQTLELIQQERITLSSKVKENRAHYIKVMKDLSAKLQEQQDWINSNMLGTEVEELMVIEENLDEQRLVTEGRYTNEVKSVTNKEFEKNENYKEVKSNLDSSVANLEEMRTNKSKLLEEHNEMEQSIKQLKSKTEGYPPELRAMDINNLEDEHKALLSDKAGETAYLQSLLHQIGKLKDISHTIKCACGEEYKVEMEM